MLDALRNAFSHEHSPIWRDSSTTSYCNLFQGHVGGPVRLAEITGSAAYERFSAHQIAKVICDDGDLSKFCESTRRISLASSFMPSLFTGCIAPIDHADGSGMNLLNIREKGWEPLTLSALCRTIGTSRGMQEGHECYIAVNGDEETINTSDSTVAKTAGKEQNKSEEEGQRRGCIVPTLQRCLGATVPSHSKVGQICEYMQTRFRLSKDCIVIAGSGDNPCSAVGLSLVSPGDVAVSLGTSDTLFGIVHSPLCAKEGHVFVSASDPDHYFALLCYKNGSLTREKVLRECMEREQSQAKRLLMEYVYITIYMIYIYIGMTRMASHK